MNDNNAGSSHDFAATLEQLESLVERLESGALSLEDSLTAFEKGIRLTREAQQRLDDAELKVRALTEDSQGRPAMAPFDPVDQPEQESPDAPSPDNDASHKDAL